MKNIVFDLGRVVFAHRPEYRSEERKRFFSYVSESPMPQFWVDYDKGVSSLQKVAEDLAAYRNVEVKYAREMIEQSIEWQSTIEPTAELIRDLKAAGYKLYVLSNMSHEFIAYLRQKEVYAYFDGEVVSCEEGVVKPDPAIYRTLIDRYSLDVEQTMFIDDRRENVEVAASFGITPFHFDREDCEKSCKELREMLL
ncbi:MAG: HAD family phosphatase [Alistipes sp.]|nr:HAD family phosphatase [Alistipes sp.]